jgi:hypothetical protein
MSEPTPPDHTLAVLCDIALIAIETTPRRLMNELDLTADQIEEIREAAYECLEKIRLQ